MSEVKVRFKPDVFEAIKIENNLPEILSFAEKHEIPVSVVVEKRGIYIVGGVPVLGFNGLWIVHLGHGDCDLVDQEDFEKTFDIIPDDGAVQPPDRSWLSYEKD